MENEYLEQLKDIEITCGYGWYGLILSVMVEISRYKYQGGKNDIKVIRAGERDGLLEIETEGEVPEKIADEIKKLCGESKYFCEFCGWKGKLREIEHGKRTMCGYCKRGRRYVKYVERTEKEINDEKNAFLDFALTKHITCGIGWYGLVLTMIERFKEYEEKYGYVKGFNRETNTVIYGDTQALYFENSHGGLRMTDSYVIMGEITSRVGSMSYKMCEVCGKRGEEMHMGGGWHETRCGECYEWEMEYNMKRVHNNIKERILKNKDYFNKNLKTEDLPFSDVLNELTAFILDNKTKDDILKIFLIGFSPCAWEEKAYNLDLCVVLDNVKNKVKNYIDIDIGLYCRKKYPHCLLFFNKDELYSSDNPDSIENKIINNVRLLYERKEKQGKIR
jgi:hypothetical protein